MPLHYVGVYVSYRTRENARSTPIGVRNDHLHLAGHTRVSRDHTEHVIGVAGRLRRLQGIRWILVGKTPSQATESDAPFAP
jgi:hypothetical protein